MSRPGRSITAHYSRIVNLGRRRQYFSRPKDLSATCHNSVIQTHIIATIDKQNHRHHDHCHSLQHHHVAPYYGVRKTPYLKSSLPWSLQSSSSSSSWCSILWSQEDPIRQLVWPPLDSKTHSLPGNGGICNFICFCICILYLLPGNSRFVFVFVFIWTPLYLGTKKQIVAKFYSTPWEIAMFSWNS